MKTDISKHKNKIAFQAQKDLPVMLLTLESGDLIKLGRLCECVCQLTEYFTSDYIDSNTLQKSIIFNNHINGIFKEKIVLILSHKNKRCSYSFYDLVRFLRGEYLHGKSDNRDNKRKVIHDYVFEKNIEISFEYIVSWNWVAGPNILSKENRLRRIDWTPIT